MDYTEEFGAGYASSEARYADVRAARERRRLQSMEFDQTKAEPPPYENFVMEDVGERKKGSLVRVVVTQSVVCALLVGGIYGAKNAAPKLYTQLQKTYTQVMQTDMSVKEVWAAAKQVFASLRSEIYVSAPYQEAASAAETTSVPDQTESALDEEGLDEDAALDGMGGIDIPLEYEKLSCAAVPLATTVRPLRPVSLGEITSSFGYRIHPISGDEGVHAGLDIAAPEGTPIYNAFYGKVKETGKSAGYGNYIIVEHVGGMETLYAHCAQVIAQEGMVLRAGDVIAYVGATGKATGPHLHFEVRLHGLRCDPAPLFGADLYPLRED